MVFAFRLCEPKIIQFNSLGPFHPYNTLIDLSGRETNQSKTLEKYIHVYSGKCSLSKFEPNLFFGNTL